MVLGGATGSGASTGKGHAGRTPTVCAAKRQMINLNKIVFLVRIPWFVYLRVRIPWVRIPLVRIPLGGIPSKRAERERCCGWGYTHCDVDNVLVLHVAKQLDLTQSPAPTALSIVCIHPYNQPRDNNNNNNNKSPLFEIGNFSLIKPRCMYAYCQPPRG